MRNIRYLIAALAIGLLGSVAFANPASAADLGDDEKCMVEVVEKANGGEYADEAAISDAAMECHEAPNPLLPATYEIFWGAFGFAVVLAGMWFFAVPAMKKTLDARAEKIQGDIDAAEAQRAEADAILAEYKAQLADARTESARIIEESRQAADEVKATLVAKAEADIVDLKAKAAADIEAAKVQAVADLRGEVAALAIGAAESVVGKNLDKDTNVALVEAYINQVGAKS